MSETDITFEAPSAARCIVSATCDLHRRTNQIIEPWPLEFVGNVRCQVGQQKVPITPWMVLTENAMQRQLHSCWGWGLRPSRGDWILLRRCRVGFCCETCTAKLSAFPGSNRATRTPDGLRTSAAPP